ncbi:cell division protein SepF [Kocuria flava]|uniref:cell division protein SepF n=1 Tax=Kocuria flava TaxID=446860 RepID=UPI001FF54DF5|nr:cell division protein SepF [Kocuria flava]MCJ8505841.1 cell division protein SepF [Kocuria flava]
MAGALRRTMIYLGLAETDEDYDDAPAREEHSSAVAAREEPREARTPEPAAAVATRRPAEYRAPVTPIKRAGARSREDSSTLRTITTVHPRSYNDAKSIGEAFREGTPVIMNVSDMGEAEAKRLVDFSAGLVFALHGSIERVTGKVFLLTPSYVEVVGQAGPAEDADGTDDDREDRDTP